MGGSLCGSDIYADSPGAAVEDYPFVRHILKR